MHAYRHITETSKNQCASSFPRILCFCPLSPTVKTLVPTQQHQWLICQMLQYTQYFCNCRNNITTNNKLAKYIWDCFLNFFVFTAYNDSTVLKIYWDDFFLCGYYQYSIQLGSFVFVYSFLFKDREKPIILNLIFIFESASH